jgi:hypothetical protein
VQLRPVGELLLRQVAAGMAQHRPESGRQAGTLRIVRAQFPAPLARRWSRLVVDV